MRDQALRSKVIRLAHQQPDLRPYLLPLVTKTAAQGFHGTNLPGLQKIVPDPKDRKVMSSLGTWATGSRDHARMYGDRVYEVDIPDGKYLEAPTDNFDQFWFDEALVGQYLTKGFPEIARFSKTPGGSSVLKYFRGRGPLPLSWKSNKDQVLGENLIRTIQEVIFRNWDYLKSWRAKRVSQGYDGVIWKNSGIDIGPGFPHDVYLVWSDLQIVRELTPEEVSALDPKSSPDVSVFADMWGGLWISERDNILFALSGDEDWSREWSRGHTFSDALAEVRKSLPPQKAKEFLDRVIHPRKYKYLVRDNLIRDRRP